MTPWGEVKVGDHVTSRGRHGAGQPIVVGVLVRISTTGDGLVRLLDGRGHRTRSIRNLRKLGES